MEILQKGINPVFLNNEYIEVLKETVKAKPEIKYLVLDNFFKEEMLDQIIEAHKTLEFTEAGDKILPSGQVLPYDGAMNFGTKNHIGGELFFSEEGQDYITNLVNLKIEHPRGIDLKLRTHNPNAEGFGIHSDSKGGEYGRDIVIIGYFNKNGKFENGGLLQLGREEEVDARGIKKVSWNDSNKKMDFLNNNIRLNVTNPGGGFKEGNTKDLLLVDQIVPVYNRVFICNFKDNPSYHSVTPSNGKVRENFVQGIFHTKKS